ncbi:MAG: hypothetical protein EZS28_027819, partial [Streblomastix strix]
SLPKSEGFQFPSDKSDIFTPQKENTIDPQISISPNPVEQQQHNKLQSSPVPQIPQYNPKGRGRGDGPIHQTSLSLVGLGDYKSKSNVGKDRVILSKTKK